MSRPTTARLRSDAIVLTGLASNGFCAMGRMNRIDDPRQRAGSDGRTRPTIFDHTASPPFPLVLEEPKPTQRPG